jgi:hypothetical protein
MVKIMFSSFFSFVGLGSGSGSNPGSNTGSGSGPYSEFTDISPKSEPSHTGPVLSPSLGPVLSPVSGPVFKVTEGDFSFITDEHTRSNLQHVYDATTRLGHWALFDTDPIGDNWLTASCHDTRINDIGNDPNVDKDGHTGYSMSFCLWHMRKIKKVGWINYVESFKKNN